MLGWWIGRRSTSNREDEDSPEYPETPAPVFAARAFKSAIFGTPAPKDDDTFEIAKALNTAAREGRPQSEPMSPTKRGILMTPGTATARRKTVTFGANIEHELKRESKSGIPDDCPGKFPSPWVSKDEETLPLTRRTNLTQTLENARESTKKLTPAPNASNKSDFELPLAKDTTSFPRLEPNPRIQVDKKQEVESKKVARVIRAEDTDLDFTVDLNEPRSQSGRHWKREYEKYHEEAQERMGHLIRYKQLAKDYAKIKDDEAMEMREQLEQEQQNIINMESYIAKLISAIEDRSKAGNSDVTPELTKELARQTALAVQYKEQVQQFRAALEKSGVIQKASGRNLDSSSAIERALLDARREIDRLKDQLTEATSVRSEVKRLKLDLSISERKHTKLRDENLAMAQQLEQYQADLERCERDRRALEEQAEKRSDVLQSLQRDYESLKQLAKRQRSDADLQQRQRQEQVATLRKELLSTRYVADSSESEKLVRVLQQKIAAHDKIVQEYEAQIARLRSQELKDLNGFNLDIDHKQPNRNNSSRKVSRGASSNHVISKNESHDLTKGTNDFQQEDDTEQQDQTINVDRLLDSMIPEVRTPTAKRGYAQKENRSLLPKYTHSTTPRSSPSVLREITNGTSKAGAPDINESSALATPGISKRFSDMSLDSPAIASISRGINQNEPARGRNSIKSPRPAMINIEDTPGKPKQFFNLASEAQGSSRASSLSNRGSLKTRPAMPPERAAAARARLEQKKRETLQRRMKENE